jgi:tetratricopeptide (TPR) repeat protein
VFLFGTPSGGLAKASLARWLKPQLRDMSKKGEFILKLRAEWDKQFSHVRGKSLPFMLSVVAGLRDEFVPSESSLDPFPMNVRFVVPGNHLEIVKPSAADHESVQLVVNRLVGNAAPEGPWNAARVAIESRDFYHAINLLETREAELDPEGLVQLALSLEGVGRQDDAIAVLARHGTSGTDAMGVLAGRLKRRWLLSHGAGDAASARKYYAEALAQALTAEDYAQAYYHAINIAFFQLFADKNRVTARATAEQVLEFCAKAKLEELAGDRKWRLATEGEALLHLGRTDEAYQRYRQAVEQYVTPREVESMYRQAIYLSRGIGDEAMRRELTRIFRHEESP